MRKLTIVAAAATVFSLPSLTSAATVGLYAEFWDIQPEECISGTGVACIQTLDNADALMASRSADANFIATTLNYPYDTSTGPLDKSAQTTPDTLADYLGVDAASLSGQQNAQLPGSIFMYTGFIDLSPGLHNIQIKGDNGARLIINGQLIDEYEGQGAFNEDVLFTGTPLSIELLHWNDGNQTDGINAIGLELIVDGEFIADANSVLSNTSVVPIPAAVWLFGSALALLGWRRRMHASA